MRPRKHQSLIAACLFHDLGHLLHGLDENPVDVEIDDGHEVRGVSILQHLFSDAVLMPIHLHGAAKRYLCAIEHGYLQSLSPASQTSLHLQGGAFNDAEAAAFTHQPFAQDAIQLRRWDDAAKDPSALTPPFSYYMPLLDELRVTSDSTR